MAPHHIFGSAVAWTKNAGENGCTEITMIIVEAPWRLIRASKAPLLQLKARAAKKKNTTTTTNHSLGKTWQNYIHDRRKFRGGNSGLRTFTFSLAQRSLCPVGMIALRDHEVTFSLAQNRCVQLACQCALRDHEVTFFLAQGSYVSSWHVP